MACWTYSYLWRPGSSGSGSGRRELLLSVQRGLSAWLAAVRLKGSGHSCDVTPKIRCKRFFCGGEFIFTLLSLSLRGACQCFTFKFRVYVLRVKKQIIIIIICHRHEASRSVYFCTSDAFLGGIDGSWPFIILSVCRYLMRKTLVLIICAGDK